MMANLERSIPAPSPAYMLSGYASPNSVLSASSAPTQWWRVRDNHSLSWTSSRYY